MIEVRKQLYEMCDKTSTSRSGMDYLVNYYIKSLGWSEEETCNQYKRALYEHNDTSLLIIKCIYALELFKQKYKISNQRYSFERLYILNILRNQCGVYSTEKSLCFIDEFQNYSSFEINTFKLLFSSCAFNLFGDFAQKVENKGLSKKDDLKILGDVVNFTINDNLRNAKEITDYINHKIGMKMNPIGVRGTVKEGELSEIRFVINGRTAIIGNKS
ncbi:MAG: hypothetical protein PUA88_07885 [Bacillales bacterium]|nr:hypothetical protein [Bacillales bacterium]